jgi:hypothetical protein
MTNFWRSNFNEYSMPAAAVVLTPEAGGGGNVPSAYATIIGGKVVYDKSPTAFCSVSFNRVLQAYGGTLKPEAVAGVPISYAKVVDGLPRFVLLIPVRLCRDPFSVYPFFDSFRCHRVDPATGYQTVYRY